MGIGNKVIRVCLNKDCKRIYLDRPNSVDKIQLCKKCDYQTGVFDSLERFYNHIDRYGIDTDQIVDLELKKEVCAHYGIPD